MNYEVFWPYMFSYRNTAHLVKVEHADETVEDRKSPLSTNSLLVMSGCIFNGEALSKKPPKTRVKLRFDDDIHEMNIVDGAFGDFDSVKLTAFYAIILVQIEVPARYSMVADRFSQTEPVFGAHGILLEQELGGSDNFQLVTRRFHRVGVFCIEIVENSDSNREFMNQLYCQKDTIEIT